MSAADLVDWLKNDRGEGAENVPAAGFVPWCPGARTEKGTPKIDPLRGRNGVCALVPAVPSIFVGVEVECMKSRPDQDQGRAGPPLSLTRPAEDMRPAGFLWAGAVFFHATFYLCEGTQGTRAQTHFTRGKTGAGACALAGIWRGHTGHKPDEGVHCHGAGCSWSSGARQSRAAGAGNATASIAA
jgi:hypothetical protein